MRKKSIYVTDFEGWQQWVRPQADAVRMLGVVAHHRHTRRWLGDELAMEVALNWLWSAFGEDSAQSIVQRVNDYYEWEPGDSRFLNPDVSIDFDV